MILELRSHMNGKLALQSGLLFFAALGAGCEAVEGTGPGTQYEPRLLDGEYNYVFEQWNQGTPQGHPAVQLTWQLPSSYRNEPFRVYAGEAGGGYGLIATVTSCKDGVCAYTDTNVLHGQSYDYYVATLDERDGAELATSEAIRVSVPQRPTVAVPGSIRATALDGAAFVQWAASGAERYMILSEAESGDTFLIGETDGTSFIDDRADNGIRYRYFLAAVDQAGHVSSLSSGAQATPRPDFFADIVYATADSIQASGFRFVTAETGDPIVRGDADNAHWRLEASGNSLLIVPRNGSTITAGTFTTALTCGPGSDANCVDIRVAPATSEFGSGAVTAQSGNTYVMRVTASDNRIHYAKIRVQGSSVETGGKRLLIFDWAYQLKPDEPSLNRITP